MEDWQLLELEYARRLRSSTREERRTLYAEAYSAVGALRIPLLPDDAESRTAGTSKALVDMLLTVVNPGDHILEVGCGRGYTALRLAPAVSRFVGTDVSSLVLEEARALIKKNSIENASFYECSALSLLSTFEPGIFDLIISIDVHEHLHPDDAIIALRQIHELLRPGGRCIIVTPNRLIGPHDITKKVYPDVRESLGFHLNETTYGQLIAQMKQVGFSGFQTLRTPSARSRRLLPPRYGATFPATLSVAFELLYSTIQMHTPAKKILQRFVHVPSLLNIRLISIKQGGTSSSRSGRSDSI